MTDAFVEPKPSALMLLGRGKDVGSERGVDCPGGLPTSSDLDLEEPTWEDLARAGISDRTIPITYMNSTTAINTSNSRYS